MSRLRYVAYRIGWAGIASLAVTIVLFLLVTSRPNLATHAPDFVALDEGLWDPADPVYVQYVDWLHSLVTLEWGTSQRFGVPVADLLAERARITAAYFVPAVVFGTIASTVLGYAAAVRRGKPADALFRGSSLFVLAVPNFVIAAAFVRYVERRSYQLGASSYDLGAGVLEGWNPVWLAAAAVILGTHVAAAQLRHVRAQSSEYLAEEFVRVLRAKGLGPIGIARHVLRAAAVPLASLFVAEVVGLLMVSVFVIEAVLKIPGIGNVAWQAAGVSDAPVIMVVTILVAVTVVLAAVAEDVVAVVLDPRIADDE